MSRRSPAKSEASGPPATHLLLVSIGNTRVAIAPWADGRRGAARHVKLDPVGRAVAEAQAVWDTFPADGRRAAVIASVNPPGLDEFRAGCEGRGIGPVLVVGDDLDLPLPVDLPEPEKVGIDRLCAAAAAYEKMKCACVVADFGTAVTIDLIADNGVFLGGTILPGMALAAKSLHEYTALLPLVEVGRPTHTLGKDTASAIRNGIFAMMAGALREVTERYATDIGKWPPLIVTGGDGEAVASACDFVDHVVPDLGLDGLVIAYRRAFEQEP
ncbi:MAG: type III pantothenate kinase [Planctomycetes bacterium]|nr:type III pantothenate kinase [Planctomycetota bacterium]